MVNNVEKYMNEALKQAKKAYEKDEVPVGAVIVKNGKIIARGYNLRETKQNALAHAEIICINKACKKLKNWRLEGCTMYVTLYPCKLCLGAIKESRLDMVYYGAKDDKLTEFDNTVTTYLENKECSDILKCFFKQLRKK